MKTIFKNNDLIVAKLDYGKDILEEITNICIENKIYLGKVEGIGAVQKAVIGYYDQKLYEYKKIQLNQSFEIVSLIGNISLKDEKPFPHLHISLADEKGKVFGGHLFSDTIIFACEVFIKILNGKVKRTFDETTKLYLW